MIPSSWRMLLFVVDKNNKKQKNCCVIGSTCTVVLELTTVRTRICRGGLRFEVCSSLHSFIHSIFFTATYMYVSARVKTKEAHESRRKKKQQTTDDASHWGTWRKKSLLFLSLFLIFDTLFHELTKLKRNIIKKLNK